MMFLFGEKIKTRQQSLGKHFCGYCQAACDFVAVTQHNYFTLFFVPLLPLQQVADYWQCEQCGNSFLPKDCDTPTYLAVLYLLLAYLAEGYGYPPSRSPALALLSTEQDDEAKQAQHLQQLQQASQRIKAGEDIHQQLQQLRPRLNPQSQYLLLIYAIRMNLACVEVLSHDDRVRLNWLASHLGVEIYHVGKLLQQLQ